MSETITVDHTAEVLENVRAVAASAGMQLHPHPSGKMLMIKFNMGSSRSQTVFIEYSGRSAGGHDCITFLSLCKVVKKERILGGGLGKAQVLELLRRNARLHFAHFALESFEGRNDVLMVKSSQLAASMETDEFKMHVACVAHAADQFEQECGQDVF